MTFINSIIATLIVQCHLFCVNKNAEMTAQTKYILIELTHVLCEIIRGLVLIRIALENTFLEHPVYASLL